MKKHQYGHPGRESKKNIWVWIILSVSLLWGLGVVIWTTKEIAHLYGNHPSLGQPSLIFNQLWYNPLLLFVWPAQVIASPEAETVRGNAGLIFVAPFFLVGGLYIAASQKLKGRKDLHGSARWANYQNILDMGYLEGKGVYVGGWFDPQKKILHYLRHNGPEHILCFAPTRSGKGIGLIIPTLLAWHESSVVLDIKGENWALTSGYLAGKDHKTLKLDLADPSGASACFNSLAEIRLDTELAISDTQQVALMVMDPEGHGLKDYWDKAAFGFLGGVILHCLITSLYHRKQIASLYDVSIMLEAPDRDGGPQELFAEMIETDHAAMLSHIFKNLDPAFGTAGHVFIASAARGMLAKADKEMAGVVSSATANLTVYRDPVLARNISRCDFHIRDLMKHEKPINLYLVVSPDNIARLRPLLRIFLTQLLGRLMEKMEFSNGVNAAQYKHRLLLMLDEFTSLGKLPIIEQSVAFIAGYGIKGYFIVQDTKQLTQTYGPDSAIMANCHIRIAYAPNLPETAEYLSKLSGTTTVVDKKVSLSSGRGGRSRSTSITETSRPLLTPDECLRLPSARKDSSGKVVEAGDMLVFTAGQYPIYGRQILYFLDPIFSARTKIMPPSVSSSLYIDRRPGQHNYEDYLAKV